jgi:hypothetical protein
MDPWYKVVTPRKEVREGRSFNPDEFAIALEQVIAGGAPEDYQQPKQFFSRTCFTGALVENSAQVLRRLAGKTDNTSPVQTLVTQMGGGKTHMLTTLWHLANSGPAAGQFDDVQKLLDHAQLQECPAARVAVFVGNAWDPQPGRETPWIDLAYQIAGDAGVAALGTSAKEAPPGTETLNRIISLAGKPVLLLFDEVLNFFSRHRSFAEPMHAFIHNIMRGFVGTNHRAAVISLPRSQVEMTDFDLKWQDMIVKVVGAVAKPLLVNDESEISEVIRRRLFEDIGSDQKRRNVARAYADWCYERRAQLPPEWTAVDTTATEKKARELLESRFEKCYPFHPATISVFQRKWTSLQQFQQTRGALAMFAQWISLAQSKAYQKADKSALITLGSAPLFHSSFRSVVLNQLGETRLLAAIDADIAGDHSHAAALDVDTKGVLLDIHRRVGSAILFESSGGQVNRVAHLPELRFALGEPELDTTTIDTSADALERRAFFIQRVGGDGYKVYHKAKIDKAVHDRRASLDDESETKPKIVSLVKEEFKRGASVPTDLFEMPFDATKVSDTPRLSVWVVDPEAEWTETGLRQQIAEFTKRRGKSDRLYPAAIVWCVRKPGRDLRDKVELMLAWKKVQKDVIDGVLGQDYEKADLQEIQVQVKEAEDDARDEIWAVYRFVVIADQQQPDGVKVIDLGAGHSSTKETLCGRIIGALKAEALLNESVGAGYIERNWPPAFKESGAWPLASLRQSFLNGALTRLLDPDSVLRNKCVEFISRGDFGLASGPQADGTYQRVWFKEMPSLDEISFDPGVLLLRKDRAEAIKKGTPVPTPATPSPGPIAVAPPSEPEPGNEPVTAGGAKPPVAPAMRTMRVAGTLAPELWNRLGTKILPRLRSGSELTIDVTFTTRVDGGAAQDLTNEVKQILNDLGLSDSFTID